RNACGTDAACIKAAYEERLTFLQRNVCYPRDDSPVYQKPAPAPQPVPQPAPQPKPKEPAPPCSSSYKIDHRVLYKHEGGLFVQAYVPGYHRADKKHPGYVDLNFHRTPQKGSGVTIGVGVDLSSTVSGTA
ncbi:MAG: hypothetical protein ACYCS3_11200, partial [Acidithiobacillus sp.]